MERDVAAATRSERQGRFGGRAPDRRDPEGFTEDPLDLGERDGTGETRHEALEDAVGVACPHERGNRTAIDEDALLRPFVGRRRRGRDTGLRRAR